jgi:hypothetical protein
MAKNSSGRRIRNSWGGRRRAAASETETKGRRRVDRWRFLADKHPLQKLQFLRIRSGHLAAYSDSEPTADSESRIGIDNRHFGQKFGPAAVTGPKGEI